MKILHIITDLGQGGAETVLFRLIGATGDCVEHAVVSLHQESVFGPQLRARGISVLALAMQRGRIDFAGLRRLRDLITDLCPDVIQTWLYHADLVGGLVTRFTCGAPVVWGVHSTELGALRATWKTRGVRRLCAWLSHVVPSFIVSVAKSTARLHADLGYDKAKLVVIRNGVDPESFRPDPASRDRIRAEWSISSDEVLLGCVARWDPLKDHANLLQAIATLARRGLRFRCALVGNGMTEVNSDLQRMIERIGVRDRLILAGTRGDVPAVMAALDLHVLPSWSESLPVAVIEAMGCGTPCVVTDVGDAGDIVGNTGWIVPPRDSRALAAGIEAALADDGQLDGGRRGDACRARVVREFSLARMASEYAALWARAAALRPNS